MSPTNTTQDPLGSALLWQMLRIRRFEEKAAELYSAAKIRGFLHLSIGEEAIAAGVMAVLDADDAVVSTYREHGHALARGVSAKAIMAEMYGKAEGCCHGRGGSMHLFDLSKRFYGGNAIVAGGLPIAVGLALADKLQGRRRVTACFLGDGSVAEGEFHEAMNLSALWQLPVLFLCENNLYAMGTAIARALSETDLCRKAESYRVPAERVDGMDAFAVCARARVAAEAVRGSATAAPAGPRFLELSTYRFRPHSMFDPDLYRTKDEIAAWKKRDPIPRHLAAMKERGSIDDAALTALEAQVAAELDEAVRFAEAGTLEPIEALTRDVYARSSARPVQP